METFGMSTCLFIPLPIVMFYKVWQLQSDNIVCHACFLTFLIVCGTFRLLTYSGFIFCFYIESIIDIWRTANTLLQLLSMGGNAKTILSLTETTCFVWGLPVEWLVYDDFVHFTLPFGVPHMMCILYRMFFFGYLLKVPHEHFWTNGVFYATCKVGVSVYIYRNTSDGRVANAMIQTAISTLLSWVIIDFLYGRLCAHEDNAISRKIEVRTGRSVDVDTFRTSTSIFSKQWINRKPYFVFWKSTIKRVVTDPYFVRNEVHPVANRRNDSVKKVQKNRKVRSVCAAMLHMSSSCILWYLGHDIVVMCSSVTFVAHSILILFFGRQLPGTTTQNSPFDEKVSASILTSERMTVRRINKCFKFLVVGGMYLCLCGYANIGIILIIIAGIATTGQFDYTWWSSVFWGLVNSLISYCVRLHGTTVPTVSFILIMVRLFSIFIVHYRYVHSILNKSSTCNPNINVVIFFSALLIFHPICTIYLLDSTDEKGYTKWICAYVVMSIVCSIGVLYVSKFTNHVVRGITGLVTRDSDDSVNESDVQQPAANERNLIISIVQQMQEKRIMRMGTVSWYTLPILVFVMFKAYLCANVGFVRTSLFHIMFFVGAYLRIFKYPGFIVLMWIQNILRLFVFSYTLWASFFPQNESNHVYQFQSHTTGFSTMPFELYTTSRVTIMNDYCPSVVLLHMILEAKFLYVYGFILKIPKQHFVWCVVLCNIVRLLILAFIHVFSKDEMAKPLSIQLSAGIVFTTLNIYVYVRKISVSREEKLILRIHQETGRRVDLSSLNINNGVMSQKWINWHHLRHWRNKLNSLRGNLGGHLHSD